MYNRPLQRPDVTASDKWGTWGQVNVYNQLQGEGGKQHEKALQGAVRFQQTRHLAVLKPPSRFPRQNCG